MKNGEESYLSMKRSLDEFDDLHYYYHELRKKQQPLESSIYDKMEVKFITGKFRPCTFAKQYMSNYSLFFPIVRVVVVSFQPKSRLYRSIASIRVHGRTDGEVAASSIDLH